ncbi:MAG: DeoR/GlpR family DNA-binding transcription regulator [Bacteroidales bacterium]
MALSIAERHQHILNRLKALGYVSVTELSKELKVSTVTIRKDLKLLEDKKLLFRSHGSATPQNPYVGNRPVNEKEKLQVEQKQSIARFASTLIEPNDSIILASGTTINELARQISPLKGLTVICSSLIASQSLISHEEVEIIQLGGLLRKSSSSVVGPHAEKMLSMFNCNRLFIGVDGIDPEYGITTTNALEASLNQAMIEAAHKVIVLADSTKFGRKGFSRICGMERVDTIITDQEAPAKLIEKCNEKGVEVLVV